MSKETGGAMDRRRFLLRAGVVVGTGAISGAFSTPTILGNSAFPNSGTANFDWKAIRAQFNLARDQINLACYWQSSHPKIVRDAIEHHRNGLDECPSLYFEENAARFETAVRTSAAEYLEARPDDFAMTGSTTQGLGTIYGGLKLRAGQEVLSTEQDHIMTKNALRHSAERNGATVRTVSLYDESASVTEDGLVNAITANVNSRTRVIAITWVQSATGVKMPIGRLAGEVKRLNSSRAEEDQILLAVDGAHGLGAEDFSISDLGCDFFISGCHKWLFGPRGTGLVWGNQRAWQSVVPTIPSADMLWRHSEESELPLAALMTPGGFHAFEYRWALSEAFQFHMQIGKRRVTERIHALNRQCKEGLSGMSHVTLHTPLSDQLSAGLVCFNVDGLKPEETFARLKEKRILGSTTPPYKYKYARVTPGIWNTPEDIDATLRAIHSLR